MSEGGLTYRDAGVDIDAAQAALGEISRQVQSTKTDGVLSDVGSFGGLFRVPGGLESPVLVASTDGVGTKLKIAILSGRHETVGADLVNHCVNDILVQGATPLFFQDYVGVGKLEPGVVEGLVAGVARGCRENGCALLGGETAEMPDFYAEGDYDIAGTIVGIVEEKKILDGSRIEQGDAIIALGSNGFHTNGYSLIRRILFDRLGLGVNDPFPEHEASVADVLLRVHRSYLKSLKPLLAKDVVRGLAHITGGGLVDNVPRILPKGTAAEIDAGSWDIPRVFRVLQEAGEVDAAEMYRAFNMGVGMVLVVPASEANALVRELLMAGENAWVAGKIVAGDRTVVIS